MMLHAPQRIEAERFVEVADPQIVSIHVVIGLLIEWVLENYRTAYFQ
jgi:hypothetical protein